MLPNPKILPYGTKAVNIGHGGMKVHYNGIKYNQPLHHYATHHILFGRIPPLINQIKMTCGNGIIKNKKMVVSAAGNNEPSSALRFYQIMTTYYTKT